jgi:acetate kinase
VTADRDLTVLALNSGSSSLKFGLYRVDSSQTRRLIAGEAESIGEESAIFHVEDPTGTSLLRESAHLPSQKDAVARIARWLTDMKMPAPQSIGHRIVHGGPKLKQHCLINDSVLDELNAAVAFAPLHMPPALSVIRFARTHFPGLPQIACFDTSFHADMPDLARVLPIPHALRAEGVERYGFHGLSCESIVRQLGDALPANLLIAHLGSGASITAVKDGKSIDTSMGLTPTGGDPISAGASRSSVRVLPSQEDEQIARQAWTLYRGVRDCRRGRSGPKLVPGPRTSVGALAHRRMTNVL